MTAKTARRLRTAMIIMMVCIPVSFSYEFIDTGRVSIIGLTIGILLAMPLALLEESTFDERMRRLPYSVALLAKSLTYVGSLFTVFLLASLVFGLLQGLTMQDFRASLGDPNLYLQVVVGLRIGIPNALSEYGTPFERAQSSTLCNSPRGNVRAGGPAMQGRDETMRGWAREAERI